MVDFKTKEAEIKEAIEFGAFHIADFVYEDRLFHYTSLDAMQKILESKVFFATEYHYLNDMDEFSTVADVLLPLLEKLFIGCEKLYTLMGMVVRELRVIQAETDDLKKSYYVISFSLSQDNLTLWTEFANYGCNLGLNYYVLQKGISPKLAYAGRVLYTTEEKEDVMIQAICWIFSHYFDEVDVKEEELPYYLNQLDEVQLESVATSIVQLLFYFGMAMKDELYEAEKEYRLIFSVDGCPVHFRQRNNMLIPYIQIPIAVEDNFPALSTITLAPLGKGAMKVRAMEQFLDSLGLEEKEVLESRLNLRY